MNLSFQDKKYWEEYYAHADRIPETPSPFAMFLVEENTIADKSIIELGCGNGRDAKFFAKIAASVTAVDQCANTTGMLNEIEKIISYPADFTNLNEQPEDEKFDVVYSRFTMHAIDEIGEDRTLKWTFNNLKSGGFFCSEARTTKDERCGTGVDKGNNIWFYNDHHRRFIVPEEFEQKVAELGFEIISSVEARGFAPHRSEDPFVHRLIAKKP